MTAPVVLVHGTHGLADRWWKAGSPLRVAFEAKGLAVVSPDYAWTGEMGGLDVPRFLDYPADPDEEWNARKFTPWVIAGRHLLAHVRAYAGGASVSIVSHSHGLQVVSFACAFGLKVDTLLSISGPVRHDMRPIRAAARANIGRVIQTFDPAPKSDQIGRAGMLGDGQVSTSLELPEADLNLPMPGFAHSGLLTAMTAWSHAHLYDLLLGAPVLPGLKVDATFALPVSPPLA